MLEKELQFERELFFFLNGSEYTLWDNFFYIYSYMLTWLVFYVCFLWVFIYKKNWKEIVCILLAISLLVLLCDQISSGFFKPVFHRFRPTHHPDFLEQVKTVLDYRGGRYGFISGHAANAFGFATFCTLIFRNKLFGWVIFLFATITAYSRVYLGVHFISDIVVGAFVGILIALLVYWLYNFARFKCLSVEKGKLKLPVYSAKESYFLCGVYVAYIVIILLFNNQLITIFK
jgi:undecaprenyl-diphosphatase